MWMTRRRRATVCARRWRIVTMCTSPRTRKSRWTCSNGTVRRVAHRFPPAERGRDEADRAGQVAAPAAHLHLDDGYGSEEIAVEAMKRGADDYIAKGRLQIDELEMRITRALRRQNLETENVSLRQQLDSKFGMETSSASRRRCRRFLKSCSRCADAGDGAAAGRKRHGKELIAKAIHRSVARSSRW